MSAHYEYSGGFMSYTLATLRDYVRDLTGVYSTDIVSNTLLNRWINEAYTEVALSRNWTWRATWNANTTLDSDGESPVFSEFYHPLLAYRAAMKVLGFEADDSPRSTMYQNEYQALYTQMVTEDVAYVSANYSGVTNRGEMRSMVRTLLGEIGRELDDQLINMWLREDYNMLSAERNWEWLREETSVTLTAGSYSFTLPTSHSRVSEVFIVTPQTGSSSVTDSVLDYEVVDHVPHVLDMEYANPKHRYAVSYNGVVTISPESQEDITVRVRYYKKPTELTTDASTTDIDLKFRSIIPYMTATKAALHIGNKERASYLSGLVNMVRDTMYNEYQVSHNMEPIQIGGRGLETRKYLPWFRSA
jgi:hypothetical protein